MKYEKWSAGYWLLKQYIIFADWLIHKKVIVTGKSHLPKNKPVIFAPNHQNALSDPMAILLHSRFQPVWLARADIFEKSEFINKILRFLKIMPVYRLIDGKENLGKNEQTFSTSIKVLQHHSALALFPEAAHSRKRQMLIHKKAVPRIAFMAAEKTDFTHDIQIVPCGIYYSHYWKFNRILIVQFGNPIPVSQYLDEYRENPGNAVQKLRQDIYNAIDELTINITSKKHYDDFENIRVLYGKYFLNRQQIPWSPLNQYLSDIRLCRLLDELEKIKPHEIHRISDSAREFSQLLKELKIRNWLTEETQNLSGKFLLNLFILLLTLPLALYGFIFNAIPFFVIDLWMKKKVKDKSFLSSFFLGSGILLFPMFYLLLFFTSGWILPDFISRILFACSLPFAGKIAFLWYIGFRKTTGRFRMLNLKRMRKDQYNLLITSKESLYRELDELIRL